MQSAFQGANWGFLVTLFKRETATKKEKHFITTLYRMLEAAFWNQIRQSMQVQKASQHRMGRTERCGVFSLKMAAGLKVCLLLKAKQIHHKR